jgi:hypothetical protein
MLQPQRFVDRGSLYHVKQTQSVVHLGLKPNSEDVNMTKLPLDLWLRKSGCLILDEQIMAVKLLEPERQKPRCLISRVTTVQLYGTDVPLLKARREP